MAGITAAQAQQKLDTWMAALDAVSVGQEYEIAGRKLVRANLADIQQQIEYWNRMVIKLSRSTGNRMRVRGAVPSF